MNTALERIEQERKSLTESLNLSNLNLTSLPRELFECHWLKDLNLSGNKLRSLYGLANLKRLTILSLNGNEFSYFPTEILELKLLTELQFSDNRINSVPQGILELQNLQFGDFQNNEIESLPQEIAQLPNLKSLILDNNPLKRPPIEIALRGIDAIKGYFEDFSKNQKAEEEFRLLSIAIDQYQDPGFSPQEGRIKEARELAGVLKERYGFIITELHNQKATSHAIYEQLNNLAEVSKERDSVIIYFSGQIADGPNEIGIFPFDMDIIHQDGIYRAISRMHAQHVLIIIDFYFYSNIATQTRNTSFEGQSFNSRWLLHRQDSEWKNRFTSQLTKFLQNLTSEVGVQELYSVLKDVVIVPLNLGGDEGGMFYFKPLKGSSKSVSSEPTEDTSSSNATAYMAPVRSQFREFISKGRIQSLFTELGRVLDVNSDFFNQYRLLNNRFDRNESNNREGRISRQDYSIARNQINSALLDLIDELNTVDFKSGFLLKEEPSKRSGPDDIQDVVLKINEKITTIESLRRKYLDISSIAEKSKILESINIELSDIQRLREESGDDLIKENVEDDSDQFLAEERLWQNALSTDSIKNYQEYLDNTTLGTYRQEAMKSINDLRLRTEEDELFQRIKSNEEINLIDSYRSQFPDGKYFDEVEAIFNRFEAEDQALWERTQEENTVKAYSDYIDNSKLLIFEKSAHARKEHLEKEGSASRINEAKLIFVGNGRVGKTSLSKRLVKDQYDPNEKSTHGIRIKKWQIRLDDGREVNVNIWDFGGQEIYHNTHRFFLTNRALYILVWDSETQSDAEEYPEKEQNFVFNYWLDNVSHLSQHSPVLVVQNKMEDPSIKGYDLTTLKENEDWNVKETLSVSAAKSWNIDVLKQSIGVQFQMAPKLKDLIGYDLGAGWLAVRNILVELSQDLHYLKYDKFLEICLEHDISEQNAGTLSRFLTDIGVIIHFPNNTILKEMVILNPRKTTRIIYRFLNEQIKARHGEFTMTDLTVNMKEEEKEGYKEDFRFRSEREIQIFLELMRNFEICFQLADEKDIFIVPQFLNDQKPEFEWDSNQSIKYGYKYDFLHNGIIARLIVKLNKYAERNNWWRTGILINKDNVFAKIEAISHRREIRVEIVGAEADAFRKHWLDEIFREVNDRLVVEVIRYCPVKDCNYIFVEEKVLALEEQGQKSVTCTQCNRNISIAEVLGRNVKDIYKAKIFISYAHEDEQYKEELQSWLNSLQYSIDLKVWDDRQIKPGSDWHKEINDAMEHSEFIIFLVSTDFLASKFIKEVELKRSVERHNEGKAVIMPVIVRPCLWQQPPLNTFQVIPKDGKPITAHKDTDSAWLEVLEKIRDRLQDR